MTEKPFAADAVSKMEKIFADAGYECKKCESYKDVETELKPALASADALVVRSDNMNADVMDAAKNVKIIVRAGAGVDTIDLDAATQRDIVVMNTPGQNANAVAELAFGMMLMNARNQ